MLRAIAVKYSSKIALVPEPRCFDSGGGPLASASQQMRWNRGLDSSSTGSGASKRFTPRPTTYARASAGEKPICSTLGSRSADKSSPIMEEI